jgi:phospholipase/lecithinase/hemolysin
MNRIAATFLFAAATLTAQSPATPPAPVARPYTQLYVFGDSYSDTGAGYVDGNGLTSVAYLAQRLAIPFTYYGAPDSKGKGLNFAVSGARTGAGNGRRYPTGELLSLGMKNQVDEFAALLQSGDIQFDPAQTMFFLAGGLNDRGTPSGYTRANLEDEIDSLYSLGARRFMVALLPTKIPSFATAGQQFNSEIALVPAGERAKHPDLRIATSDWGVFYDAVITNGAKYGLTDTTTTCAGRTIHDENPDPCLSPETHFYYHQGHPSTAAHRAVGDMLYSEALTKAP